MHVSHPQHRAEKGIQVTVKFGVSIYSTCKVIIKFSSVTYLAQQVSRCSALAENQQNITALSMYYRDMTFDSKF